MSDLCEECEVNEAAYCLEWLKNGHYRNLCRKCAFLTVVDDEDLPITDVSEVIAEVLNTNDVVRLIHEVAGKILPELDCD